MMRLADVTGLLGTLHSVEQRGDVVLGVLSVKGFDFGARADVQHEVPCVVLAHVEVDRHEGHPRMWVGELCRHQGRLVLKLTQAKSFGLVGKGDIGQGEPAAGQARPQRPAPQRPAPQRQRSDYRGTQAQTQAQGGRPDADYSDDNDPIPF